MVAGCFWWKRKHCHFHNVTSLICMLWVRIVFLKPTGWRCVISHWNNNSLFYLSRMNIVCCCLLSELFSKYNNSLLLETSATRQPCSSGIVFCFKTVSLIWKQFCLSLSSGIVLFFKTTSVIWIGLVLQDCLSSGLVLFFKTVSLFWKQSWPSRLSQTSVTVLLSKTVSLIRINLVLQDCLSLMKTVLIYKTFSPICNSLVSQECLSHQE